MRRAAGIAGVLALGVAWSGPLRELSSRLFAAHMTMHMIVVAVAAPLIAIGLANSAMDPVRWSPAFFSPIPASLVELIVVWGWHAPALHHAARQRDGMFVAEQASFLAAGLLLWCSAFGGASRVSSARSGSAVVAVLLTFAHMTLLGALLSLTPRPLYRHAESSTTFTALADQQLGGAIMLAVGAMSYITAGLWLSHGLLQREVHR